MAGQMAPAGESALLKNMPVRGIHPSEYRTVLERIIGGSKALPSPEELFSQLKTFAGVGHDFDARPAIGSGSPARPLMGNSLMPGKPNLPSALSGSLTSRNMSQIPTHAAQMAGAEVPTAMAEMAGAETPTLLAAQEPGISSLGRGVRAALGPGASAASDIFDASWRTIAGVGAKAASSPVGRALGSVLGSRVGQMALGPWGVAAMEAIPSNTLGDGSLGMSEMPKQMYSGSYDGADAEPDSDTDDPAMTPANWGATDQIRATPLPSPQPGRDLNDLKTLGSVGEPLLHDLGGGAGGGQLAQAIASAVSRPRTPQPDPLDGAMERLNNRGGPSADALLAQPGPAPNFDARKAQLEQRLLGSRPGGSKVPMGFGM